LKGGASTLAALTVEGASDARERFDEESGVSAAFGVMRDASPEVLGVFDREVGVLLASR